MADKITLKAVPPIEAIKYFRSKGYKIGFDYRDVERQEHAYAFTVAKAMKLDILQDIRAAVDEAIAEGKTFADFRERLEPVLQEKGWWGKKKMTDPLTGEVKMVRLGSTRRLRTIFDTNLRTAYSAGRWERIQRTKKTFPYLRYVGILDSNIRPQHRGWHDTVLPADHAFWEKHYPPNGWNCRCTVQQLSDRDLERRGLKVGPDPRMPERTVLNKRTGELRKVPVGVDPSFDYNPGIERMKALIPPPIDKPLQVAFAGDPATVPMPSPRAFPLAVWPDGLKEEEYVKRFMGEFGAKLGETIPFIDKAGEQILISDALFRDAKGKMKVTKRMRHRWLGLLAQTIKDPDEIWHVWQEYPKGRRTLTRRYMARWMVGPSSSPGFVLFDVNSDGWTGVTGFKPDDVSYLELERGGALVYRRPKK